MSSATFDIETNGLMPEVDRVWCICILDHETGMVFRYGPDEIPEALKHLEKYDTLHGHHCIGFDFPVLKYLYGWEYEGKVVDTLQISRLQRPGRLVPPHMMRGPWVGPHSVEAWGGRLGLTKVAYSEWDKFTPEMMDRCETDVRIQFRIHAALMEEGRGEGWAKAHQLNTRLFQKLAMQEQYGWLVDEPHMDRCVHMLTRWIDMIDVVVTPKLPLVVDVLEGKKDGEFNYVRKPFKKDGTLSAISLRHLGVDAECDIVPGSHGGDISGPFTRISIRHTDLNSNAETKEFLLGAGWQPAEWNTDAEGVRTSPKLSKDDPFDGLEGKLGQLVAKRVQCRHRRSTVAGLYKLIREDGRIPSVVLGLAITGRARHTNIVNIPGPGAFFWKWMRRIFIAKPGWVLVGVDSMGNQIRQLAARMNDPDFSYAVLEGNKEDGTDLHSLNQKRAGLPSRTKAKNFFYGFMFGAGDAKLGAITGGGKEAGARYRAQFLEELPALADLISNLTNEWRATAKTRAGKWGEEYYDGYITGLDGRPIQVDSEHKVLVFQLQSDEAIQMATAYCIWHKWMEERWPYKEMWGTVIWYHDEWQWECHPSIAEESGQLGCDAIKLAGEYYHISCPHAGEYSVGANWMETH